MRLPCCAAVLCIFCHVLPGSAWPAQGPNLCPNPGFEQAGNGNKPAGWEATPGHTEWTAEQVRSGKRAAKVFSKGGPTVGWTSDLIPVRGGDHWLMLSGWAKTDDVRGGSGALMVLYTIGADKKRNGQTCIIHIVPNKDEGLTTPWTRYSAASEPMPPRVKYVRVNVRLYHASGTVYYDDISVREIALEPLTRARPIRREFRIAAGREPACAIVPSADGHDHAIAIQQAMRDAAGVTVPVVDPTSLDLANESRDLVVLGNLQTNPAVEYLYLRYYTYEDRHFPGAGGFVVRPLYDPLGTGANFVVIAASDPEGLSSGVHAFTQQVQTAKRDTLTLDLMVKIGKGYRGVRCFPWPGSGPRRELRNAALYLKTGDKKYARTYRDEMLKQLEMPSERLFATDYALHLFYVSKTLSWDLMDSIGVFSDDERLRVTQWLLGIMRSRQGFQYSGIRPGRRSRENHGIRAGRGFYFGWRHFNKYYRQNIGPETMMWEKRLRGFWDSPFSSSRSYEDSLSQHAFAGSLSNTLNLAFCEPEWATAFLHGGYPHRMAERCIAVCNNMGTVVQMGDTGAGDYPAGVFAKLAYYYRDGRYLYMIEKRGGMGSSSDEPLQGYCVDLQPVEPVDHLGVHVVPADQLYYDTAYYWHKGKKPPLHRTFDKLTFRSGFDPDDEYLMLDGTAGGSHSYDDTNTIGEYSANGRIWLCQVDIFNGPTMNFHNGLTVARDGFGMAGVPPCAELVECAQGTRFGYTATALRDYNGVDWVRHIVWLKGQYFFVLDEATALQAGDYSLALRWRGLGRARLEPGRYVAAQDDEPQGTCRFDGSRLVASATQDSGKVLKVLPGYGSLFYRGDEVGDFVETTIIVPKAGAYDARLTVLDYTGRGIVQVAFDGKPIGKPIDQFYAGRPRRREVRLGTLRIAKPGKHTLRFEVVGKNATSDKHTFAVCALDLYDPKQASAAAARAANRFHLRFPKDLTATLDTDREVLGKYVRFSPHAEQAINIVEQSVSRELAAGHTARFCNLFYATKGDDPKAFELLTLGPAGALVRSESGRVAFVGVGAKERIGPLEIDADLCHIGPERYTLVGCRAFRLDGRDLVQAGPHVVEGALENPARIDQILQAEWKKLSSLQAAQAGASRWASLPRLKARWRLADEGGPLAVAARSRGQTQTIVVGHRDHTIVEISADGKPLHTFAAQGPVHAVAAVDLDRDGSDEVLAGSDDEHVYALGNGLEPRWKYKVPFMRDQQPWMWWTLGSSKVRAVHADDIDGDGRPEVLLGVGNMHFHALDAAGKPLWHFRTDHGTPTTILAADIYNEGKLRAIVGMGLSASNGYCRVLDEKGQLLATYYNDPWCTNLKAIAVGDLNHDGKNMLFCGNNRGNLRGYVAAGPTKGVERKPAWLHNLAGDIRSILLVPGQAPVEGIAVAASDSGYLSAFRENGDKAWGLPLSSAILRVAAVRLEHEPAVLAACKDGKLFIVDAQGKLAAFFDCREQIVDAIAFGRGGRDGVVITKESVRRLNW